jgi:peptide/nickel transport system permease protein
MTRRRLRGGATRKGSRHIGGYVGGGILALITLAGILAPWLAPHPTDQSFTGLLNAPPTRIHIVDQTGRWRVPFIYPWTRISQLEQRYEEDRSAPVAVAWFTGGHIVQSSDETRAPLLLFGADSYGRDVFARLLFGARVSLGLSLLAALGATLLGGLLGAAAGYMGGAADEALMRGSEFVLVLPAMYVALALRSIMPIVLPSRTVFLLLMAIFAVVGAPFIARGVRGIVRSERRLDYATAAASLGAGHVRIVTRHLLPAARGFIGAQLTMLMPAFIVSEATMSYVGLGFPESVASWGTMLHDASNVRAIADFPWMLSPAAAIFVVVLGLNLMVQGRPAGLHYERPM